VKRTMLELSSVPVPGTDLQESASGLPIDFPVCSMKRNLRTSSSFTWASLEVTLFGLFQLFKGGDFAPVDYPSLSNK